MKELKKVFTKTACFYTGNILVGKRFWLWKKMFSISGLTIQIPWFIFQGWYKANLLRSLLILKPAHTVVDFRALLIGFYRKFSGLDFEKKLY
jgi:hypothetical protein